MVVVDGNNGENRNQLKMKIQLRHSQSVSQTQKHVRDVYKMKDIYKLIK